ncbi:hypothetical protein C8Q74DRAFT_309992 [Fomes fomentarius]|nr:hypothetical protein C8Q74DRAFT_309992 [Fomes fomentarius]
MRRTDFDTVLALSDASEQYIGPESGLYTWLDGQLGSMASKMGDVDSVLQGTGISSVGMTTLWPEYVDKPLTGSSLPSSDPYLTVSTPSISAQPVNSPFSCELWSVELLVELGSLERSFGLSQREIFPGQERFVLRDGMWCMLRRPGHRDVRFSVPIRPTYGLDARCRRVRLSSHCVTMA